MARVKWIFFICCLFCAFPLLSTAQKVKGVVLVGSSDNLLSSNQLGQKRGTCVYKLEIPGSLKDLNQFLQSAYFEQPWDEKTIQKVKQKIYEYYQESERPFVIVSVPAQNPSSGVLQFVVEESRLGKLQVVGNKWLPSKRITQYFKIKPGDSISQRRIAKDLDFANRNPFRRVNAVYSPGTKNNTTDLTIEVEDRKPYRFYVGADNTGVPTTGRQRAFAGFSWDQIFNLDQVFFYQYTTNYDIKRFHANTFQYMALLPCESILNLYGGFSILHADLPFPNRRNSGTNVQASIRYHQLFLPIHSFSQEFVVGFDLKNTNNTMEFVDFIPTFGRTVNLTQLILGYQCGWNKKSYSLQGGCEIIFSPVEWLPNQSNDDFGSLRPGAKNVWTYGVAFLNYQQPLPYSCAYTLFSRAQWSSQTLLPSEQLGLGGYDTVRGYDQRQFNTDSGLFVSNEIHFPRFSLIRSRRPHSDQMYFLLFLDGGYGVDKVAVPTIAPHNFLIGTGPGIRYIFGSYLTARLDWGIKLHHQADFTGGASMVHFSVTGSY